MSDGRLHCKFCDWSTPRFYKKTNGYERLKDHMYIEHWEEVEKLDDQLDEEFDGKRLTMYDEDDILEL